MVGNTGSITTDIGKRSKSETDGIKEKSGRAASVPAGALHADGGIRICLDGNLLSISGSIWQGKLLFVGTPPDAWHLFCASFLFENTYGGLKIGYLKPFEVYFSQVFSCWR